jgi:hypothetical protein
VCEKGININNQYFCKFITKSQNKKNDIWLIVYRENYSIVHA